MERTAGPLYHLEHARPENSTDRNPFFHTNLAELERVRGLDGEALRADIAAERLSRPLLSARDVPALPADSPA